MVHKAERSTAGSSAAALKAAGGEHSSTVIALPPTVLMTAYCTGMWIGSMQHLQQQRPGHMGRAWPGQSSRTSQLTQPPKQPTRLGSHLSGRTGAKC